MTTNSDLLDEVPMMFRSQIEGRCQLQRVVPKVRQQQIYDWVKEWTQEYSQSDTIPSKPKPDTTPIWKRQITPTKQEVVMNPPKFGKDVITRNYTISWRLVTNGGQDDSIIRPAIGAKGYPYFSGSSMKGAFRRACQTITKANTNESLAEYYCGKESKGKNGSTPGILRFHGAYPIDNNWTKNLVDIVHSQQKKQVIKSETTNANTQLSLHQVTLCFGISSTIELEPSEWENIWQIWERALGCALGGRVSANYGYFQDFSPSSEFLKVHLKGHGVASILLDKTPEFRPNSFKASLRGHASRLLGGVCSNEALVSQKVDELFGSSETTGSVQLFWEQTQDPKYNDQGSNPTYCTQGILHLFSENNQDFLKNVLEFAYLMGGFGKSWRRVSHEKFHPTYKKFEIGCHWKTLDTNFISIKNSQDLTQFLDTLYKSCQEFLSINSSQTKPITSWRDSWHPNRVTVYSKVVSKSQIIKLFHKEEFKITPAIGGKKQINNPPEFVSCVWHRMLPIDSHQYLEIVTLFHGDRNLWMKRDQTGSKDQLIPFIEAIEAKGLTFTWGKKLKDNYLKLN